MHFKIKNEWNKLWTVYGFKNAFIKCFKEIMAMIDLFFNLIQNIFYISFTYAEEIPQNDTSVVELTLQETEKTDLPAN